MFGKLIFLMRFSIIANRQNHSQLKFDDLQPKWDSKAYSLVV